MTSTRPTRTAHPSAKLLSTDNGGEIELSFHRKAIATATAKHNTPSTSLEPTRKTSDLQTGPSSDSLETSNSTPSTDVSQNPVITRQSTERDNTPFPRSFNKRPIVESEAESDHDPQPAPLQQKKRLKKRPKVAGKSEAFALV
jgi:hypothetical protein